MALLLALALGLLAPQGARGYKVMQNDRIMLFNNDVRGRLTISGQGYNDSTPGSGTYWSHYGTANRSFRSFQRGTYHVLFDAENMPLWQLINCRHGTAVPLNENYLPTSTTAAASGNVPSSACAILQNTLAAQIVSPYYEEGIGTIYFDAVNVYGEGVGTTDPSLAVEISTNLVEGVPGSIASITNYENFVWHPVEFDVLTVSNGVLADLLPQRSFELSYAYADANYKAYCR